MDTTPRIAALIVAAGTGARLGGVPKQYRTVAGKPLLRHAVERLRNHPSIGAVQVVIHPDHRAEYEAAMAGLDLLPPVLGGATRRDSVRAGLEALRPSHPNYVLIHDAARPFLSRAVLDAIIAALSLEAGVVPALPVTDTVRRVTDGAWEEVPREFLLRIQTPQAFPFETLFKMEGGVAPSAALTPAPSGSPSATHNLTTAMSGFTDDAAAWLAAGHPLRYVEGDERLRKITTGADMEWAETAATERIATAMGFDVHALMPSGERGLMRLGGIDLEDEHTLHGHSDGDVLLHAITDALLGTIADGDIGQHFDPRDDRWKGADSRQFLAHARDRVRAAGGRIQHVDATVICEQPKISPHRDAMRQAIADLLELPLSHVSVKATTTERLGFTGRREGIAAQAIATVMLAEGA